jgi:RNA polymerase-associated protein RTF1
MSESDSDSSPEDIDEDAPLFPIENKYKSEADKKEILTLPEIKREEILAERASQLEQEQQNRYLRQLLKDRAREEGKALERKKRNARTADLEDESRRKSSRQKTTLGGRKEGETSEALQEYKRQREQRGVHNEQRKRDEDPKSKPKKKVKRPDDDGYSDRDAEGESEIEWASGKTTAPTIEVTRPDARGDPQPSLIDFERCKVGSGNFAEVCFYPKFEDVIVNCFARVCIGEDKQTRQNVYRLAQIKG